MKIRVGVMALAMSVSLTGITFGEMTCVPLRAADVEAETGQPGGLPPSDPLEFAMPAYVRSVKIRVERGGDHYTLGTTNPCNGGRREDDGQMLQSCSIPGAMPGTSYWIDLFDDRGKPVIMDVGTVTLSGKAYQQKAQASIYCHHKNRSWECRPVPGVMLCPVCDKPLKAGKMHTHEVR